MSVQVQGGRIANVTITRSTLQYPLRDIANLPQEVVQKQSAQVDNMLTDPPTSPNRYVDQAWFGALAAATACAAQLLGAGQVYLLIGVLVPNAVLAVVRFARRQELAPRAHARIA